MRNPFRYVVATTYIYKDVDDEDFDESIHRKAGLIRVDLWEVAEVQEGWDRNTVDLLYYDGEARTCKGTFTDWCEWHEKAKDDQMSYARFPTLN